MAPPTSHTPHPTSEELAYREFFHRYQPPIFGLARRWGLGRQDAEDVVQEVMLAAWQHLDGTVAREGCEGFRGLVLRMADNKVVDLLRRQRVRQAAESAAVTAGQSITMGRTITTGEPVDQVPDTGVPGTGAPDTGVPGPAALMEQQCLLRQLAVGLEQCRQALAPRTFDAFRLYVLEETPTTQTAATLDMSVNQVYVTRHQVIQRLRRLMTQPD